MPDTSLGKRYETQFKLQWKECFPESWVFRLHDQMNGFKEVSGNPCDFLCFVDGELYMVEVKEHKGNSIPFSVIPQYERLLEHKGYKDIHPGVVVWFSEKDKVIWVDINEMEKMVKDEKKSISLTMLNDNKYKILELPSEKMRVYMKSDFTQIPQWYEEVKLNGCKT